MAMVLPMTPLGRAIKHNEINHLRFQLLLTVKLVLIYNFYDLIKIT